MAVHRLIIESMIAMRYLKAGKGDGFARVVTWFSFVGIALGVATLIIVMSVMNGFRYELLEKIVGMKGHIIVYKADRSPISGYESIAKKLKSSCDAVCAVIPQIEQQVVSIANGVVKGVVVYGISNESLRSKRLVSEHIKVGSIEDFDTGHILIGKRLAESMQLCRGDSIKLLIPESLVTPFGKLPKEEALNVAGLFEVGLNEYDKNIVLIPINDAQAIFSLGNCVTQIEVFVTDIENVKSVTRAIRSLLGPEFAVLDWQHSDASIFHAVVVEKNVMTLILSIIVLVAVFNIISCLTMLTNSKRRDIAILRTIGATRLMISRIFFMIGSAVGITGTVTGVTLGLAVSLNIDGIKRLLEKMTHTELFNEEIYFLSQIPSKTDWLEVSCVAGFSLVLCLLATIYPSKKASKLDPVDVLRT
ncbi:MAG: lipoprotein-releasing ABC transporter permease subunit [Holosporales bacterium]|jgi:lipoprotein-releasing system permease protein|nr:lipoprotein-releasing ABC transporter permease subunit [Holosporales bacterium]